MSDNQKKSFVCLLVTMAFGLAYYFWGDDVLAFIGRTVFYWFGFFLIFIFLCNCVYCIVKDVDDLKGESFFEAIEDFFAALRKTSTKKESKKEKEDYVISPEEADGEAIQPAEDLNVEEGFTPPKEEKNGEAIPPARPYDGSESFF